jgi:Spy/CpxP family protein refolding chaperone
MKLCNFILPLFLLCATALSLNAQDDLNAPKVKGKIEQIKKVKLIDLLQLDEKSADKFLARYSEYDRKEDAARSELQKAVAELENAVAAKSSDIKAKSDAVIAKDNAVQEANNAKLKAIRSLLNDEQYAKFVIFEQKFYAQLQKALLKRREKEGK